MVLEELRHVVDERRVGGSPVVVSEIDNLPWSGHEFRRYWRKIANAAGMPKALRNMDSRVAKKPRGAVRDEDRC